jgi:hypothetical protein
MREKLCEICGKNMTAVTCNGCGKMICKECRSMEICTAPEGEIGLRFFCSNCKTDPKLNPQREYEKIFGLEDITDMVNQDQEKTKRIKIKIKI